MTKSSNTAAFNRKMELRQMENALDDMLLNCKMGDLDKAVIKRYSDACKNLKKIIRDLKEKVNQEQKS